MLFGDFALREPKSALGPEATLLGWLQLAQFGHFPKGKMGDMVSLLVGAVFAVCGIHAVVTRRVVFGHDGDDLQVYLFGWRAVAVGVAALALAALSFCSAAGLVTLS